MQIVPEVGEPETIADSLYEMLIDIADDLGAILKR